ncbi:thioredoxin domain-containing protein [Candidatus Pacearchaeota archaeon]|nr:thioredoxin domain-containing protein [Candidatus Pacearchaeota archaeon]
MRPRTFSLVSLFLLVVFPLMLVNVAFASEAPILLDFSADWCGPCKSMEPTINKLANDGFDVRTVNIDQRNDLAKYYRVSSIPCLVIVDQGGNEHGRLVGIQSFENLQGAMLQYGGRKPANANRSSAKTPQGKSKPAWVYVPRPERHRTSVLRILTKERRGTGTGSGTLIKVGPYKLVITVSHVIRGATEVVVQTAYGNSCPALVVGYDKYWDCALLQPTADLGVDPVEVAEGEDAVMDSSKSYETCGWGPPNTQLACSYPNQFRQWAKPKEESKVSDWMELVGWSRPGNSGGPVFNDKGQLVGLVWGGPDERMPEILCVQPGRVHAFLIGFWNRKHPVQTATVPQSRENAPRDGYAASTFVTQYQLRPSPLCNSKECPNGLCPTQGGPGYGRNVMVGVEANNPTPPQAKLPWRKGVEGKIEAIDNKVDSIPIPPPPSSGQAAGQVPDMVPVIRDQIGQTVPKMIEDATKPLSEKIDKIQQAVAPISNLKERLDAAEASGGLKGKIAQKVEDRVFGDASDKPVEQKKGFFSKILQLGDDKDFLWIVIAIVGLFVLWKKGGIHHIIEGKREKLEADVEAGGLKGKAASKLLKIHDGELGERLGEVEDRLAQHRAEVQSTLSGIKAKADTALSIASKVVPGVPNLPLPQINSPIPTATPPQS